MTWRILVVEDDEGIRRTIDRGLRLAGHEPAFAVDLAEAGDRWRPEVFDVVLLDIMLPDGDGIGLLERRRAAGDATPVVIMTAREDADLRDRAFAAGASASVAKPFAYGELVAVIDRTASRDPTG